MDKMIWHEIGLKLEILKIFDRSQNAQRPERAFYGGRASGKGFLFHRTYTSRSAQ
jgi:hypothetical protein